MLVSTLDPELQDEILTVLRRVDENWAEGMLGDKVGIFPLLYVEVRLCHPSPPGVWLLLAHPCFTTVGSPDVETCFLREKEDPPQ